MLFTKLLLRCTRDRGKKKKKKTNEITDGEKIQSVVVSVLYIVTPRIQGNVSE